MRCKMILPEPGSIKQEWPDAFRADREKTGASPCLQIRWIDLCSWIREQVERHMEKRVASWRLPTLSYCRVCEEAFKSLGHSEILPVFPRKQEARPYRS